MNFSKPLFMVTALMLSNSLLVGCQSANVSNSANASSSKPAAFVELDRTQSEFFDNLSKRCGQTFVGYSVFPDDPKHDFAGKQLVAKIASCSKNEIRIPFSVGEDHSRTWIISKTANGLLLKHDHRHHDGTPDEITLYGGYAKAYEEQQPSQYQQFFHADAHTAELIPAASSNVWMLQIEPQTGDLIYYLERHQQPRYKARLRQK
ncbi:hypothetical protein [Kangiella sp. TOML190]|uniref:hypothetical protein n=1 Tax=Kangiella sp. TOML190 TaxID=2931351 RepID=UPI002042274B|nr:hypothetical protein [Kangiella sp. TOML190]